MGTKTGLGEKIKQSNYNGAGLGKLYTAKAIYNFALDGGAQALITPKQNCLIPKGAVIVGGTLHSTTAGVGASSTQSFGTSAGSSATALLGATAVTSQSVGAIQALTPTFAVPVKMTAKGYITMTNATANLTAGVYEITIFYYMAAS